MEYLVYLKDNNVQNEIFRLIMRGSVLYERRFIREAFYALSKAKQLAGNFEQDIKFKIDTINENRHEHLRRKP
jgi:hypothetical protein